MIPNKGGRQRKKDENDLRLLAQEDVEVNE